jgi:hypothetical protein
MAENYDDLGINVDCLTAKLAKEIEEDILYCTGSGNAKAHAMTTAPDDVAMQFVGRQECINSCANCTPHVSINSDSGVKNVSSAVPAVFLPTVGIEHSTWG